MEYYYYRLPGVLKNENFLNLDQVSGEVIVSTKKELGQFKTLFIDAEIGDMTKDQRYLFSLCDKELYREGNGGYND